MDYKKTNAPTNTVTRDMIAMADQTGNVYETVCIIGKRAKQIAVEMKKGLEKKLAEFATTDNLEETAENHEQNADSYSGVSRAQALFHQSLEGER